MFLLYYAILRQNLLWKDVNISIEKDPLRVGYYGFVLLFGQIRVLCLMSSVDWNPLPLINTYPPLHITTTHHHAGHTRKASRISKAAVDNCGKGVGNFYLS